MRKDACGLLPGTKQARFLQQDRDLQHVRDAFGFGDDVILDRGIAELPAQARRRIDDLKLLGGLFRIGAIGRAQEARTAKLVHQQRNAFGFGHLRVMVAHRRFAQQFGDDAFMHGGVLPKVHDGQMETEALHRFAQFGQAPIGQIGAAVLAQRIGDHRQGRPPIPRRIGRAPPRAAGAGRPRAPAAFPARPKAARKHRSAPAGRVRRPCAPRRAGRSRPARSELCSPAPARPRATIPRPMRTSVRDNGRTRYRPTGAPNNRASRR